MSQSGQQWFRTIMKEIGLTAEDERATEAIHIEGRHCPRSTPVLTSQKAQVQVFTTAELTPSSANNSSADGFPGAPCGLHKEDHRGGQVEQVIPPKRDKGQGLSVS